MINFELKNYNLPFTLLGGQSFHWDAIDDDKTEFIGFTQNNIIRLKYTDDILKISSYPDDKEINYFQNYFNVNEDYTQILVDISKDEHIKSAIKKYPNLRIQKQDFEQTLLSYILSANNNIKAIRRSIRILSEMLGEKLETPLGIKYLFPKTETIAATSLETLLKSGIGFRAKYLKSAAQYLLDTSLSERIYNITEEDARNELLKIRGIGNKIADCVLCFSLGFKEVTPIDVWAKRVVIDLYGCKDKNKYEDAREWFRNYFPHAALAGQFLFEYIRGLKV